MPSQPLNTIVCPICAAQLPAAAERCARCDATSAAPRIAIDQAPSRLASERQWLDTRWFVLVLLFGVAAAFGLPLLWYSQGFSWLAKIVWTILVVLYTGVLLWLAWLILSYCYASICCELEGAW